MLLCSIWPAGISSEPQGTVQWAGGMINWNDPDYISAGTSFRRHHLPTPLKTSHRPLLRTLPVRLSTVQ